MQWKKMTKAQKRVAIAKDVLAQLEADRYEPEAGQYIGYVRMTEDYNEFGIADQKDDVKTYFDKIQKCQVCALGACLLSITKFENKLTFADIDDNSSKLHKNKKVKQLLSLFTPRQLLLIENAFEGFVPGPGSDVRRIGLNMYRLSRTTFRDKAEAVKEFDTKYPYDRQKLAAIMQNIIKNKGTFVL